VFGGFGFWVFGFRVRGRGFWCLVFSVCLRYDVSGLWFGVHGFGFKV
jgi:hypothetical protein